MKDFERIKEVMSEKGIKQIDLVNKLKIPRSNVSSWLSGKRGIPKDKIIEIADLLQVSSDFLLGINDINVRTVPIIGTASCGGLDESHLQIDNKVAYYNGSDFNSNLYCVIANGDSMAPEIEDGDEIICDPFAEPQNGDIVHYRIGNESAIKIYFKDEDAFILQFIPYNQSENFKTKTIRLDDELAEEVKISKVVSVNKLKFNNRSSRLKLVGRA